MAIALQPLPGYPFALQLRIAYALGEDGLVVTTTATNAGPTACPFGAGQHPYLSPGTGLIDECTLQLPAGGRILTDPERMLPTEWEPLDGGDCDFREPRRIGPAEIDSAFTDLERDSAGRATVRLAGPDGARELWVGEAYPILQLYTGDGLAPERRRRGLGAEPMTCPPDALRSGEGLLRLQPGRSVTLTWGARLV
jgi:aldose 1-epimerase